MKRTKSLERYFYALDYEKRIKSSLTKKQLLVYTYLMSISKWDAQGKEEHYYVYTNSFVIKDVCKKLGISQPTWRSAIKKLGEENLIKERETWYEICFPAAYAPLHIHLISFLLEFSSFITNSGNLVGVYATLYKYWKFCQDNYKKCTVTINQLLKLFETKHDELTGRYYELILGLFTSQGLTVIKENRKKFQNHYYTEYEIQFMNQQLPPGLNKEYGSDDIKEIVEALETSLENDEQD